MFLLTGKKTLDCWMSKTYASYNNIVSSLGFSSEAVVENIHNEIYATLFTYSDALVNYMHCNSNV